MKANFRVIATKWVLKSSSCFCLAKNRWSQLSPPVLARQHGLPKVFLWLQLESCRKDFLTSLEINEKIYPFFNIYWESVGYDRFWWQVISTFEGRFAPPWTKKKYTKLVSLISLMLPRSRSFHLSGTIFVYGWTDSINIKIGKFKGQRRKVINLWWLSYIW